MLKKDCDIIIPVFNQLELTRNCLKSIEENTDIPYSFIIVDNASGDDTKKFLKDFSSSRSNVSLIENKENLGWVKAVNQALKLSASGYVCIMNNDTVVKTKGWLSGMIEVAESADDIGLVNPKFCIKKEINFEKLFTEVDFCRGYCVLIKRAVIDKIGFLDEAYGLGYYDDDDYSVRAITAGYRCVRANSVVVLHLKDCTFSALFEDSRRRELHEANKRLFYSKWGKRLKLIFIIGRTPESGDIPALLLKLARKQHVIDIWNLSSPLRIEHTSIREKILPRAVGGIIAPMLILSEKIRKPSRRHDLTFVITAGKDMKYIEEAVSTASRV